MKEAMKSLGHSMHQADPAAQFRFEFWDGEIFGFGDEPRVLLRLNTEKSCKALMFEGFMGFGESYTHGEIEVEGDLQELLRLGFATDFDDSGPSIRQKYRLLPHYLRSRKLKAAATEYISYHYDRGNDFFALFLDDTMTYSCGYFESDQDSLKQAQLNKYDHICRKLMLTGGETLLDIGCGWGGMLIHAAQNYGVRGVGNTLSRNQYEYANRKIEELGLQDRVQVVLADYRDLTGQFDKFVSIGMFEHVGKENLPAYMRKTCELLKEGGLGLLHTIGKDVEEPTDPWTLRYIFPGGYLPSLAETIQPMGCNKLCVVDVENLRLHYARTLDLWIRNYERNVEQVREMYDEVFVRMWRLYLNTASAGFKHGDTRLYQILFSKGLTDSLPLTRAYCYNN